MKIEAEQNSLENIEADILIIGIYEKYEDLNTLIDKLDSKLEGFISEIKDLGDFTGKMGEISIVYTHNKLPAKRILFIGLGKKENLTYEIIRRVSGILVKKVRSMGIKKYKIWLIGFDKAELNIEEIGQAIAEGTLLGNYRLLTHKTQKLDDIKVIDLLTIVYERAIDDLRKGITAGKIIGDATCLTRDLTNEPSNVATPTYISKQAKLIADEVGIECKIFNEKEIEEMRMGAFLSVARGSNEPCKLVVLDYNANKGFETIVLIGKGITFDTGGISLKSSSGMLEMKQDMAGAAVVLGVLKAAAQLKIPLHLVGITPLTENTPGGKDPNLPGDIVTSRKGKTIEILNTDAEGRLILADALDYANEFNPKIVIDIATLTGACRVALGIFASGLFSTDDELVENLIKAGKETNERLWRLPLWKEHEKTIESKFADVRNINTNRQTGAGASSAAAFLKQFIGNYRWAHIDIAGTDYEYKGSDYIPTGASGIGVRLLIQYLQNLIAK
ncbi:MAG: leucyl aminopeptidase [Candidatus Helarchaeota archaeon]